MIKNDISETMMTVLSLYDDYLEKNFYLPYVTRVGKTEKVETTPDQRTIGNILKREKSRSKVKRVN